MSQIPTSLIYMATNNRTNPMMLYSRISDISEDTGIQTRKFGRFLLRQLLLLAKFMIRPLIPASLAVGVARIEIMYTTSSLI